ncbi:hypothetical protein BDR06DRAFT_974452 [Suillus hirtellus]|nr:hypothetical protein BDR06DRAFT_974452 [Suillus hirtellus]
MLTFMLELSVSFLESLCEVCVLASGCVTTSGVAFSAWKSLCIIFVFVLWRTFMWCMPLAIVSHSIGHNLYVDFLRVYGFGGGLELWCRYLHYINVYQNLPNGRA